MRSILTISLPKAKKDLLVKRAKKAGKNVSAYILSIIEMEQDLISEDELVEICKKGMEDYKEGRTKVFKPSKDYLLK